MWVITEDEIFDPEFDSKSAVGVSSPKYDGRELPFTFRMLDDDGEIYYVGRSSSDSSFAPLDDYGTPNAGCTSIEYYSKEKEMWEIL